MKKIGLLTLSFVLCLLLAQSILAQSSAVPGAAAAKKLDLVCVQKAVEKREIAIIAAHDKLSAAIKTALEQRKTALVQAWGITDRFERNKARIAAWNNFKKARREARKTYNTAIRAVWKQFHQETKACKVTTQGVEPEASDLSVE